MRADDGFAKPFERRRLIGRAAVSPVDRYDAKPRARPFPFRRVRGTTSRKCVTEIENGAAPPHAASRGRRTTTTTYEATTRRIITVTRSTVVFVADTPRQIRGRAVAARGGVEDVVRREGHAGAHRTLRGPRPADGSVDHGGCPPPPPRFVNLRCPPSARRPAATLPSHPSLFRPGPSTPSPSIPRPHHLPPPAFIPQSSRPSLCF